MMHGVGGLAGVVRALASVLAPKARRGSWRRQWEAEIAYARGAGDGAVRYSLGAFRHAAYLRRQEAVWRCPGAEIRQSIRGLARRPTYTVFSIVTLGVGIGVATAIFSLAEAMLFRPLPLEEGNRLVQSYSSKPSVGFARILSFALFGTSWFDPRILAAVGLLLASTALLAGRRDRTTP